MITDVLFTSPILQGEDFGGAGAADGAGGMVTDQMVPGAGGAPGGMGGFGADFENDPLLAQALRISMDEERARQNEEAKATGEGDAQAPTAGAPAVADAAAADGEDSHDEEYYIEQAKRLSMMPVDEALG